MTAPRDVGEPSDFWLGFWVFLDSEFKVLAVWSLLCAFGAGSGGYSVSLFCAILESHADWKRTLLPPRWSLHVVVVFLFLQSQVLADKMCFLRYDASYYDDDYFWNHSRLKGAAAAAAAATFFLLVRIESGRMVDATELT